MPTTFTPRSTRDLRCGGGAAPLDHPQPDRSGCPHTGLDQSWGAWTSRWPARSQAIIPPSSSNTLV